MVVQLESEAPEETLIQKQALMESKKYVVFKNHVRELKEQPPKASDIENVTTNIAEEKRCAENKRLEQRSSSSEDNQVSAISNDDLQELKTVYKKCKSVIAKIERKYGHLLDLDDDSENINFKRRKLNSSDNYSQQECACISNKKILFTEDGEQLSQVQKKLENHICSHNNINYNKNIYGNSYENIEIDYDTVNPILPETIKELTEILKDHTTKTNLRSKVVEKIKYLRYENLNTIRCNKESLVKQLKRNPEEILDFKGTNISALEGYPTK